MKVSPRYKMPLKRRSQKKTNYKRRLGLLLSGKPRLVVRKSLRHMKAQLVKYERAGDKVLVSATTHDLENFGWKGSTSNITSAYLLGFLIGTKAVKKKAKEAVFDIGLQRSLAGTRIYATLKGAVDAGMEIPCSEDIFPSEERIAGKHIESYGKALKEKDPQKFKSVFTKSNPEQVPKMFESVKAKISKG
ncbi:50S ribosomal protein L18 [Candidatus Micrarchaeota archaeon RBG_16_49_10]|nr:large subunit ribosomal protein L18 [uncultured archaeon]OGI15355.1 MAG: 50S ribosomal protein L18 [Candidatus Micrarchaeota archaeon RBG_16_49_10]